MPPARFVKAFEDAAAVLWRRSCVSLGEVTLGAIVDRVLHNASEQFPALSSLRVDSTGISCGELRENAERLPQTELRQGLRFVLIEFLAVLGSLTAEILTPALHAELSQLGAHEPAPARPRAAKR